MSILGGLASSAMTAAQSAIGSAASAGGGLLSGHMNRMHAEKMANLAIEQSNTAYQRQMRDMYKAGLNPILAAGKGGGASTPSFGHGQQGPIDLGPKSAFAVKQERAGLRRAEAEADIAEAQADRMKVKQPFHELLGEGSKALIGVMKELGEMFGFGEKAGDSVNSGKAAEKQERMTPDEIIRDTFGVLEDSSAWRRRSKQNYEPAEQIIGSPAHKKWVAKQKARRKKNGR